MGRAGRFACVFTPMVLTVASLVCLIIVALGGTDKNNATYNHLYFFRANTSDLNVDPASVNLPANSLTNGIVSQVVEAGKAGLDVKDFYHVSLWNYCSGDFGTNSDSNSMNADRVTFCSPHTNGFWFNPVEVWGLNNTAVDVFFSKELRSGLAAYKTASKWMFIAYLVALIATIVEILVGILALFSRIGSLVTTIVSAVSSLFTIAFALTATILYSVLAGTFNTALNKYNIHGSLGRNIYVVTWLAVIFSLASGFFWLLSSCCCSGHRDRTRAKDYGEPFNTGRGPGSGQYGFRQHSFGRGRTGPGQGSGAGPGWGGMARPSSTPYVYQRMASPSGKTDKSSGPNGPPVASAMYSGHYQGRGGADANYSMSNLNQHHHSDSANRGQSQYSPHHAAYEPFRRQDS